MRARTASAVCKVSESVRGGDDDDGVGDPGVKWACTTSLLRRSLMAEKRPVQYVLGWAVVIWGGFV
jgi:hypothetical protein